MGCTTKFALHINITLLIYFSILFIYSEATFKTDNFNDNFNSELKNKSAAWSSLISSKALSQLTHLVLPSYVNFSRVLNSTELSPQCRNDIGKALSELNTHHQWWAFSLFNSWGKFLPSGAFRGTLTDYGDFDQCIAIEKPIKSQYCLVDISLPMPSPVPRDVNYHHNTSVLPSRYFKEHSAESIFIKLSEHSTLFYYNKIENAFCLPISCRTSNIRAYLKKELSSFGLSVARLECQTKNSENSFSFLRLNSMQQFAILLFICMYSLTFYSALYDRYYYKGSIRSNPTLRGNVILWFSPLRNIRKLLYISKNTNELRSIHGIRFMTMCWIIIGHALDWNPLEMLRDNFLMKDRLSNLLLQPLYKGFNSVETFFFISGLLTSIMVLRNTHGQYGVFKCGPFLWLRYLRLTPQLIVYLLGTSLIPLLMDGPIWRRLTSKIDRCYNSWWINLSYMQNFVDPKNICELQTWYLAVDMQMHWFSLLPIVVLLRFGRNWATVSSIIIIMCSICISSFTLWLEQFPPGSVYTWRSIYYTVTGQMGEFHERFLYFPWNHSILFFSGLVFGFYLEESSKKQNSQNEKIKITENQKMSVLTKYTHWFGVFALYLFSIYATLPYIWGRPFNGAVSAILFPSQQAAWAAMLAWLIWLCSSGNGGAFGRIICWRGWQPLSRLTYAVYLSHGWILYLSLGSVRSLLDYHPIIVAFWTSGLILVSYCVGFTFSVVFETPLINFLEEMKHCFVQISSQKNNDKAAQFELTDTKKFLNQKSKNCFVK